MFNCKGCNNNFEGEDWKSKCTDCFLREKGFTIYGHCGCGKALTNKKYKEKCFNCTSKFKDQFVNRCKCGKGIRDIQYTKCYSCHSNGY